MMWSQNTNLSGNGSAKEECYKFVVIWKADACRKIWSYVHWSSVLTVLHSVERNTAKYPNSVEKTLAWSQSCSASWQNRASFSGDLDLLLNSKCCGLKLRTTLSSSHHKYITRVKCIFLWFSPHLLTLDRVLINDCSRSWPKSWSKYYSHTEPDG